MLNLGADFVEAELEAFFGVKSFEEGEFGLAPGFRAAGLDFVPELGQLGLDLVEKPTGVGPDVAQIQASKVHSHPRLISAGGKLPGQFSSVRFELCAFVHDLKNPLGHSSTS